MQFSCSELTSLGTYCWTYSYSTPKHVGPPEHCIAQVSICTCKACWAWAQKNMVLEPLPPSHDKGQESVAPIIEQRRMATILEEVKFLNWVPYVPHGHKMCPCAIILPYFAQINQGFCMNWAQNRGFPRSGYPSNVLAPVRWDFWWILRPMFDDRRVSQPRSHESSAK